MDGAYDRISQLVKCREYVSVKGTAPNGTSVWYLPSRLWEHHGRGGRKTARARGWGGLDMAGLLDSWTHSSSGCLRNKLVNTAARREEVFMRC